MSTSDELERGIDLLLEQMPDYVQELVSDIAKQALLPKWQLLGGILFEAYNNGYLSAYTLDPSWKDGFKPTESVCNFCNQTYMPVRVGQLFCSNDCGCGITDLSQFEPEVEEEVVEIETQPQPESTVKEIKKDAKSKSKSTKRSAKSKSALAALAKSSVIGSAGKKGLNKASGSGWTDEGLPE
jgi:hypothetical protein